MDQFTVCTPRRVITPKVIIALARELSGFIWAVFREAQNPGSVNIRIPKTVNTPKASARRYILSPGD